MLENSILFHLNLMMYVGGDLVYPGEHDTQTRQQSSKFLYSVANELDKYNKMDLLQETSSDEICS